MTEARRAPRPYANAVSLVSVLLAVHDDGEYVRLAVESLLRQTVADLELILIDDASTDGPPAYLESEDYDLWSRLLEVAEGANLALPLVLKRVHPGQASLRRRHLQASFQRHVALREIARVAPEFSAAEGERAWSFGSGRDTR